MNVLNIFAKSYSALYSRRWLPFKVESFLRWAVRNLSWLFVPTYLNKRRKLDSSIEIPVYVSLTSFPDRIEYVWQVIECMFRQTYLPKKIILWLSKQQFDGMESIPRSLSSRMNERFDIRFVEGDVRSHKKYLYISREYPDKYVFLIDDDIYYPTDILEKSWKGHLENPNAVISNYGYVMSYTSEGMLKPYAEWSHNHKFSKSDNLFFGSGGGTLFMPKLMYKDLMNIELAQQLTPLADDVWLNTMARLAHYEIVMLENGLILPYRIVNNKKLSSTNLEDGGNDRQIRAIKDYYKSLVFNKKEKHS